MSIAKVHLVKRAAIGSGLGMTLVPLVAQPLLTLMKSMGVFKRPVWVWVGTILLSMTFLVTLLLLMWVEPTAAEATSP